MTVQRAAFKILEEKNGRLCKRTTTETCGLQL